MSIKWPVLHKTHRLLRVGVSLALSLSMVLSPFPAPALQALADEVAELEVPAVVEEPVAELDDTQVEGEALPEETASAEDAEDVEDLLPEDEMALDEDVLAVDQGIVGEGFEDLLGAVTNNPNANKKVTTVDNKDYGITLNLFNYYAEDNKNSKYGQVQGTDNPGNINYGKNDNRRQLQFYGCGTLAGEAGTSAGINNFAGYGRYSQVAGENGYQYQFAMQGIVRRELSNPENPDYSQRFPLLNTSIPENQQSLDYLFDPSKANGTAMTAYTNVNHFFYEENGYLTFDSNEHYAYYDKSVPSGGNFIIYEDTYRRAEGGSDGGLPIGFFPFDEFNGGASGRGPSRPGAYINPTKDGQGQWNPNNHVDHHLGMSMTVPITMPYGGKVNYTKPDGTTEQRDMVFRFSGDDDMWVFIDGVLVMDIGGIHQPVAGEINFATGQVTLSSGTGDDPMHQESRNMGFAMTANDIVDQSVALGTKASIWKNTKINDDQKVAFPDQNRWAADTQHVVQFFYMERGGCDSNLEIQTNIHLRNEKTAKVEKVWDKALYDPENGIDHRPDEGVDVQIIRQAVMHEQNTSTGAHTVIGYTMFDHQGNTYTLDAGTGEWVLNEVDSNNDGVMEPVMGSDNPVRLANETQTQWGWKYTWEHLATGGYNTNGWIEGLEENNTNPDLTYDEDGTVTAVGNNVYCDYNYYVREVPNDNYTFVPTYEQVQADGSVTPLYPKDVPYANGQKTETGAFVEAANALHPVRITNKPVTIDVDKIWRNASGTGADKVDHSAATNDDSVWVQLYQQRLANVGTEDEPVWQWGNAEEVGTAVKLDKSNEWKTSFLASPSQKVRYFVLEGTADADGTNFAASNTMKAAKIVDNEQSGAPYVIDETMYARDGKRQGGDKGVEAVYEDKTRTYAYYFDKEGMPGEEDYTVVRIAGGDAELMQRGGEQQDYTSDTIQIVLEVPAATKNYEYKATVDLGGLQIDGGVAKIKAVGGDVTPVGIGEGAGFEVTLNRTSGDAAQTIKLNVPVSGALSAYSFSAPATISVTQTECLPGAAAQAEVNASQNLHGSYLQLSDTYTHGTATIANKPILMLKLAKVDAKAYAAALEKFNAQADDANKKPLSKFLEASDYLRNAEFALFADDGTLAVPDENGQPTVNGDGDVVTTTDETTGIPFFDENTDMLNSLRIPDETTIYRTGDDGTVRLETLSEEGHYWLVETEAPSGYINPGAEKPIHLKVTDTGEIVLVGTTTSTTPLIEFADGTYTISVPNMREYALPAAGGPGAYPFLLAGAFVAALALAGAFDRRRNVASARRFR